MKETFEEEKPFDVVIVGAGVSGLYCAWRLTKDNAKKGKKQKKLRICVIEKEERVGGRLLSVAFPGIRRMAELGGMRFTNKQVLINALIEELDSTAKTIDPDPLRIESYAFDTRMLYLRKHRFVHTDKWPPTSWIYESLKGTKHALRDLPWEVLKDVIKAVLWEVNEQGDHTGGWQKALGINLKERILKRDTLDCDEWRRWQTRASYNGKPVHTLEIWDLLGMVTEDPTVRDKHGLKNDTMEFLRDSLGYLSLLKDSNAAQTIPLLLGDFADDVQYRTLTGGMEALPRMLAYACRQDPNCSVLLNHSLRDINLTEQEDGYPFHLDIECKPLGWFGDGLGGLTYPLRIRARKVILALPMKPLQDIGLKGFDDQQRILFEAAMELVIPYPAVKLFLQYNKPWWKDLQSSSRKRDNRSFEARCLTQEDIRQIYYYGDRSAKEAFVMCYCDDIATRKFIKLMEDPTWQRKHAKLMAFGRSPTTAGGWTFAAPDELKTGRGRSLKQSIPRGIECLVRSTPSSNDGMRHGIFGKPDANLGRSQKE